MNQSSVRIASAVWVIGLVLTGFLLSVPPADLPLFIGLACIAIVPLIYGSRRYKIFGAIALIASLLLACVEYQAGIKHKERMQRLRQKISEKNQAKNAPVDAGQKP
jgi:integral membrane sensor domain MASE1